MKGSQRHKPKAAEMITRIRLRRNPPRPTEARGQGSLQDRSLRLTATLCGSKHAEWWLIAVYMATLATAVIPELARLGP